MTEFANIFDDNLKGKDKERANRIKELLATDILPNIRKFGYYKAKAKKVRTKSHKRRSPVSSKKHLNINI